MKKSKKNWSSLLMVWSTNGKCNWHLKRGWGGGGVRHILKRLSCAEGSVGGGGGYIKKVERSEDLKGFAIRDGKRLLIIVISRHMTGEKA